MQSNYIEISTNPGSIKLTDIPILEYSEFCKLIDELFTNESNHCLNYFAYPLQNKFKFICCIGCDSNNSIRIFSYELVITEKITLESISAKLFQFYVFEREIHENFGINFSNHPWLKPIRYPANRANSDDILDNYPFYTIDSQELHEVGVGPVHAGIIEPGHFRFICNGENVLHLEIQLGYQHRGIEQLFIDKKNILQQTILAESIAGDTTVGHTIAYCTLAESLANASMSKGISVQRTIALELERIAMHIGDMAALCGDVAYQFGQAVCEALRTLVINSIQLWCGNRFGKGLIRPLGSNYLLTDEIIKKIRNNIIEVEERFTQITDRIFSLPSVLARFETIGIVTREQMSLIGGVGMAARSSGLKRDIRFSHPNLEFVNIAYEPVTFTEGDVLSRALIRKEEIIKSIEMIKVRLENINSSAVKTDETKPSVVAVVRTNATNKPIYDLKFEPSLLAISLVEGWRGELCHTAITDEYGDIIHYKIKDPSLHNWMALALAVRNQEISDFPLCNKSFNLSYSGNDL
jgi:Ni,Fe-hydrogenase III large subunit